ncbi:hypothetical protein AKJ57_01375 [candidate division MSBL1 archaeon SCGC-AAA259A05]|uniref:Uncharacterized protein n=1 Tax=candidate division MSBL1 archaeon SCGC-AAA259A05 TaxID=1698259 RepID=A0A133UB17_9EURY|nr:hypothetical protein AKJ57_01375 [candidate division MSBL1 archaeon SCGC-AAA259A05]
MKEGKEGDVVENSRRYPSCPGVGKVHGGERHGAQKGIRRCCQLSSLFNGLSRREGNVSDSWTVVLKLTGGAPF